MQHNIDNQTTADFNGAAILDQNGQEVPITEDMVQSACVNLSAESPNTLEESA